MEEGQTKKLRTVADYDDGTLTATYEWGHVIVLIPDRLYVGPTPVTQTHHKFLAERLRKPHSIGLKLPDLSERRLWKTEEAARWYAEYTRKLRKDEELEKKSTIYVHFKTGCEEEVIVAVLLWVLLEPAQVPKTVDAWKAWRESNAYLWIWDERLDDTLAVVQLAATELLPAQEAKTSASASVMVNWLRKSKEKIAAPPSGEEN